MMEYVIKIAEPGQPVTYLCGIEWSTSKVITGERKAAEKFDFLDANEVMEDVFEMPTPKWVTLEKVK